MSDVSYSVIGRLDGDSGTHCNSCSNIATFKVTLRNTSFRLCESCSYELFEQMDFHYRRSKLATLRALLREAGEIVQVVAEGKPLPAFARRNLNARASKIAKKIQEASA